MNYNNMKVSIITYHDEEIMEQLYKLMQLIEL